MVTNDKTCTAKERNKKTCVFLVFNRSIANWYVYKSSASWFISFYLSKACASCSKGRRINRQKACTSEQCFISQQHSLPCLSQLYFVNAVLDRHVTTPISKIIKKKTAFKNCYFNHVYVRRPCDVMTRQRIAYVDETNKAKCYSPERDPNPPFEKWPWET